MRFLDLEVQGFQAVESARVEFAPGLNVLFGPNDLGKSTLVTAIRAALLMPPASTEAEKYLPWYSDAVPTVTLTFEADDGRFWRVMKRFRGSGVAELRSSKDGNSWSVEGTGRQVDEMLRNLLAWGAPVGAKQMRGLPETFLGNALLAGQAEVEKIFESTVADDQSVSGRERLSKALAALAQDPVFKGVLDRAQGELKQFFTETGKRRSGAKSPFTIASDQVNQLQTELAELRHRLEQSTALEGNSVELKTRVVAAHDEERQARALLEQIQSAREQGKTRRDAERNVAEAKALLDAHDVAEAKHRTTVAEVRELEAAVAKAEAARTTAEQAVAQSEATTREAEAAVQRAQSADAAQARALRRATLQARLAELEATLTSLQRDADDARRLAQERKRADDAKAAHATALESAKVLRDRVAALEERAKAAQQELSLSRAIVDYGRWQDAVRAAKQSAQLTRDSEAQATSAKRKLEAIGAELTTLDAELAKVDALRAALPDSAKLKELDGLQQQLKVAEAAIGGGVTVVVRPADALRLNVEVDDESPVDETVSKERTFDAERKLALSIGKIVEIEVTTGSKEHRKQRDALSKRWRNEGLPVLTEAAVDSVASLREKIEKVDQRRDELRTKRLGLERSSVEAKAELERAGLSSRPVETDAQLAARRERIPQAQFDVLEQLFATLGEQWERQADELRRTHEAAVDASAKQVSDARAALARETERSTHLEAAAKVAPAVPARSLETVEANLAAVKTERAQVSASIAAVEKEQGSETTSAERALAAARTATQHAVATLKERSAALDAIRAQVNERRGQAQAQRDELAKTNRVQLAAKFDEASKIYAPLATLPAIGDAELAQAQHVVSVAQAHRAALEAEFHQAEGALLSATGPQAKERVAQLTEALGAAKASEAEVELNASAWKLLHETLRAAENSEGQHLGRALAGPVSEQFSQLTNGRYGALAIGANLEASGLSVNGTQAAADDVLKALSIGTRDQLATLMRLAIARQLGSSLVLDDHLVHTDSSRLDWFVSALKDTARKSQVLIFTCRALDYLGEVPATAVKDWPGGLLRSIDLAQRIHGWPQRDAGK